MPHRRSWFLTPYGSWVSGSGARLIQLYGSMTAAGYLEGGVRPDIESGGTPGPPSKPRAARPRK